MHMPRCITPVCYGSAALLAAVLPLALWPNLWPNLLISDKYMPHGHCYLWEPGLIRLHLITDCLIGTAYVVISSTLGYLVYKGRRDIPFHWMFISFGLFIIACGATHFMEVWTLWQPQYWLAGAIKLVTAVASVVTAAALPILVPHILTFVQAAKISGQLTAQLAQINESLQQEMTERQRVEKALHKAHDEALRHSEKRYHTLAEIAPVGIFHTDAKGKNFYVNETWCQITGLNSVQGMLDGWVQAIHPEDRQRVLDEWSGSTKRNLEFKSEFRFLRPDGTIIWGLGQAKAQRNSLGKIVGYVGTVTDITERKQAEVMQLQLASIVSSSDDAIIGQTLEGVITSWNAGAENIFGYHSAEVIGRHISMFAPPDRIKETAEIMDKIRLGQRVEHFETVRNHKDGRRALMSRSRFRSSKIKPEKSSAFPKSPRTSVNTSVPRRLSRQISWPWKWPTMNWPKPMPGYRPSIKPHNDLWMMFPMNFVPRFRSSKGIQKSCGMGWPAPWRPSKRNLRSSSSIARATWHKWWTIFWIPANCARGRYV